MHVNIPDIGSTFGCYRTSIRHKLGNRLEQAPRAYTSYESPGLSPASGFEHPASTLPTRFPAALGIGYGSALRALLMHRISTRRCLSMLRDTSNGNELAMPLPMPPILRR